MRRMLTITDARGVTGYTTMRSVFGAWLVVRTIAAAMKLAHCVCKLGKYPPAKGRLRDWLRDAPDLLQDALDWYANNPDWFRITRLFVLERRERTTPLEIHRASAGVVVTTRMRSVLGGPPGQRLTPTGERRRGPRNPMHRRVTNFEGRIRDEIKVYCTNKRIPLR
jgi:hypothetical protein